MAPKILEKQTDCWRGCGHETPSVRKAGWEGSAVTEQRTGDTTLRLRREAQPLFLVPLLLRCPTKLRLASLWTPASSLRHPLHTKVAPAFHRPYRVPNAKFINRWPQGSGVVTS